MTTSTDLRGEIKKIVSLQATDSEIFDLEAEKETFPEKRKEMDAFLESQKGDLKAADNKLKELQVAKKEKENELLSAEAKIKKHEGELAQIKTNKEYKTMLEQIEGCKADVSLLEGKIIELIDGVEAAQKLYDKEKKIVDEEEKKCNVQKDAITAEEKKVAGRLQELSDKRKASAALIDKEVLTRYERILKNRGRTAIAPLNGEFCGECNIKLRAQVINEVNLAKTLVLCENCSRILYAP